MSWLLAIVAYAVGIIYCVRGDTISGVASILIAGIFTIAGNIAALNHEIESVKKLLSEIHTNNYISKEKGEKENG